MNKHKAKVFLKVSDMTEDELLYQVGHMSDAELKKKLVKSMQLIEKCKIALNPSFWDRDVNDLWHRSIPDMVKAFSELRNHFDIDK